MPKYKKKFQLNLGTGAGRGLYNFTPRDLNDKRCSFWYDRAEHNRLKRLKADDFNIECERILASQNY